MNSRARVRSDASLEQAKNTASHSGTDLISITAAMYVSMQRAAAEDLERSRREAEERLEGLEAEAAKLKAQVESLRRLLDDAAKRESELQKTLDQANRSDIFQRTSGDGLVAHCARPM